MKKDTVQYLAAYRDSLARTTKHRPEDEEGRKIQKPPSLTAELHEAAWKTVQNTPGLMDDPEFNRKPYAPHGGLHFRDVKKALKALKTGLDKTERGEDLYQVYARQQLQNIESFVRMVRIYLDQDLDFAIRRVKFVRENAGLPFP